jgi:hypothetical protein
MMAMALPAAVQSKRPDGSWLDQPLVNWNKASGSPLHLVVPSPAPDSSGNIGRCREQVRPPEEPEEKELVRNGWLLFGPVQSYGLTRLVTALSDFDGMCRPIGYQAFVYRKGRYVGSLSPVLMNSRSDGSFTNIRLLSVTRILAEFARYKESDPLCCPSRISEVTYEVRTNNPPLVVPVQINTQPPGSPRENESAETRQPIGQEAGNVSNANGQRARRRHE